MLNLSLSNVTKIPHNRYYSTFFTLTTNFVRLFLAALRNEHSDNEQYVKDVDVSCFIHNKLSNSYAYIFYRILQVLRLRIVQQFHKTRNSQIDSVLVNEFVKLCSGKTDVNNGIVEFSNKIEQYLNAVDAENVKEYVNVLVNTLQGLCENYEERYPESDIKLLNCSRHLPCPGIFFEEFEHAKLSDIKESSDRLTGCSLLRTDIDIKRHFIKRLCQNTDSDVVAFDIFLDAMKKVFPCLRDDTNNKR